MYIYNNVYDRNRYILFCDDKINLFLLEEILNQLINLNNLHEMKQNRIYLLRYIIVYMFILRLDFVEKNIIITIDFHTLLQYRLLKIICKNY